jgi:DNA-binding XRE family transcriptional regulator
VNHQIITTPAGERLVLLPEADFNRLVEVAERATDVTAYDETKRKLSTGEEELVPAEIVKRLIGGENPIRVWRDYRGLTVSALAEQAGITQAYLSQVETGKRAGTVETMKKLAVALDVTVDDLV